MTSNPFSTRNFQPGAIPYFFPHGGSIEEIASLVERSNRCHLIVGPHGSGKSSLLQGLAAHYGSHSNDEAVEVLWLKPSTSPILALRSFFRWKHRNVLLIDGYEQLSRFARGLLYIQLNRYPRKCVGTSHRHFRKSQCIWETSVDCQTERYVLEQLLQDRDIASAEEIMQTDAWRKSRERHPQNLRESLFDMYDWWRAHS